MEAIFAKRLLKSNGMGDQRLENGHTVLVYRLEVLKYAVKYCILR